MKLVRRLQNRCDKPTRPQCHGLNKVENKLRVRLIVDFFFSQTFSYLFDSVTAVNCFALSEGTTVWGALEVCEPLYRQLEPLEIGHCP